MSNILKITIKFLAPNLSNKIFGSLVVECNFDNNLYCPIQTLSQGLEDRLK